MSRLYVVRTKLYPGFDYDRYEQRDPKTGRRLPNPYYPLADQTISPEGKRLDSYSHIVLFRQPKEAREGYFSDTLFELTDEQVQALRNDPCVLQINPAKDGRFRDSDGRRIVQIYAGGTRWEDVDRG
ncbi:MAG: hypothetical protein C4542_09805 [Dehalococcoidia bacterium]|nr:MAG: hypothetical protein C4542_09805 [Dehalococcoidia bacterium]